MWLDSDKFTVIWMAHIRNSPLNGYDELCGELFTEACSHLTFKTTYEQAHKIIDTVLEPAIKKLTFDKDLKGMLE